MSGDVLELRNKPENRLNDSERGKGENIKVVVGYFDSEEEYVVELELVCALGKW